MYLVKTPWWLRALYPGLIWRVPVTEKILYLTFDDGPHPEATPFVLEQLRQYNARAVFFCIGKNVELYPAIYRQIAAEGHKVGNHTQRHLNGWKVTDEEYAADYIAAAKNIDSDLFRPPYGRIKRSQQKQLQTHNSQLQTVMWDVLSGDFDTSLQPEACLHNVIHNSQPGSIIVFHDSTKAWDRLQYALPRVLAYFTAQGYRFDVLPV
jgi:peptidoglycan/xylan/chitin deacetylase (PgdA/CDA1 family)